MAGICTSSYTSTYPIEKVGDSLYPYPVNADILPSKQRRVQTIHTGASLFTISSKIFNNFLEIFNKKKLIYEVNMSAKSKMGK